MGVRGVICGALLCAVVADFALGQGFGRRQGHSAGPSGNNYQPRPNLQQGRGNGGQDNGGRGNGGRGNGGRGNGGRDNGGYGPVNQGYSSRCPPVCSMHCQFGFQQDNQGCSICKCNDPGYDDNGRRSGNSGQGYQGNGRGQGNPVQPPRCPPECSRYCPNGFQRDNQGCSICQCKPGPSPNPVRPTPSSSCPTGSIIAVPTRVCETFSNGNTCGRGAYCYKAPADTHGHCCRHQNQNGQNNGNGNGNQRRPVNNEYPPRCPPPCSRPCQYGLQRDNQGCPICQCNSPPYEVLQNRQGNPVQPPRCPPECSRYCPNGFQRDNQGCSICQCNPPPRVNSYRPAPVKSCPMGSTIVTPERVCSTYHSNANPCGRGAFCNMGPAYERGHCCRHVDPNDNNCPVDTRTCYSHGTNNCSAQRPCPIGLKCCFKDCSMKCIQANNGFYRPNNGPNAQRNFNGRPPAYNRF